MCRMCVVVVCSCVLFYITLRSNERINYRDNKQNKNI